MERFPSVRRRMERRMAQGRHLLTDRQAKTLGPGKHSDGGNLFLIVDEGGARRWMCRYQIRGRRREMGLGGYPKVSLAAARSAAHAAGELMGQGIDPLEHRRLKAEATKTENAASETFGSFADRWFSTKVEPGLENEKHKYQWRQTLGDAYCAKLRLRPIGDVNSDDVLAVLTPVWLKVPETAKRLRGRIEAVLDAAKAARVRSGDNPARWKGHLAHLLPKSPTLTRGHHKALPWGDVPDLMLRLKDRDAVAAEALQFIILTASRPGEGLGVRWSEIDTKLKVWVAPAKRMKERKEHRVPLSTGALEVLKRMERFRTDDPNGLVFPGETVRPMSPATLVRLRARMKEQHYTTHGFRSSFRDWAAERTNAAREVAEGCLAHAVGDATELAYLRSDFLEKRRDLLQRWSDHCEGLSASGVHHLRVA
jgi:integrase